MFFFCFFASTPCVSRPVKVCDPFHIPSFCVVPVLLTLLQVDAKQGVTESPAAPRPTTRLRWKEELCRDVPVTPQKEPRAAPTILHRRPAGQVFPFADSLHPQRIVVLPKVRGARRGSSQLESPMAVGELLANNRATSTPL